MSSAYEDMYNILISDSKHKLSIHIDITTPRYIYDIIVSSTNIKTCGKSNILPLMAKPSLPPELILLHDHKHPKGASFCFERLNYIEDSINYYHT